MATDYPSWVDDSLMKDYYDNYWDQPTHDERCLYEMLCLELFQAGLTWKTVWKKRKGFERAFANFDVDQVAAFGEEQAAALKQDTGIIRNRLKIQATINNAQVLQKWHQNGKSLNDFIWGYVDGKSRMFHYQSSTDLPASDELSKKISKDMKKAGFRFVGPTIIFSYLCAVGIYQVKVDEW
ncbi:MAG TPA: DNA-3-methyladenine glycosylase I [Candidatus Limosilactobacillus merdigallinarum]|uniref:DNA-3-methyladenine glycosylase I n=1 Tax=Candidatus Limosilactobacillus merdigallinarum TaxID=2838652 RepID=A0A9D1VJ91_9LACO|nr:DNA-3-methyladenine glycosylase I [Candidatus Limosilactobacillus merdigallinarum]